MRPFLAILIGLTTTSPAIAGWQWTEWGMSEAEVRAAAPINLAQSPMPNVPGVNPLGLAGSYRASNIEFTAKFAFDLTGG